ncbi:MAG TPA: FG-GAP-like repeat-containing protein, partial [Lacunisphaera sp.]|nr:FG-GAP-like repeat-containing protein [Lacunisphaera sp.]
LTGFGSGVGLEFGSGSGNVTVSGCTITDFATALRFSGVRSSGSLTVRLNVFERNSGYNLYNSTATAVAATLNYWGTTDPSQIQQRIFDYADNAPSGLVSTGVILTSVPAQPVITVQPNPSNSVVLPGHNIAFSVAVTGSPAPALQWQKNGVSIAGATSATLTLTDVFPADTASYSVVATNVVGSVISSAATLIVPSNGADFNGDGQPDMIWRHGLGGNVVFWLMNDITPVIAAEITPVSLDWVISGTGDFNADGKTDIVWRHKVGGNVVFWLMNGTAATSAIEVTPVSTDWEITGTGDFNADGRTDIIWRHKTGGNVVFWLMNGTTPITAAEVTPVSPDWVISGTGDFNADGKTDIVWRHKIGGNVVFWLMEGTRPTSTAEVTPVSTDWVISTTGDFNGDGKTDIVWRHRTGGNVVFWLMNGTTPTNAAEITPVSLDWSIVP